jgi:ABC-type branched-subunit amino acid transport system substrate-binding protein
MGKRFRLCTMVLALMIIMAMIIPACAAGPDTTKGKPDKINIVYIGDFSGPYSASVGPARYGLEDALGYVNKDLGGVHGVPIVCVYADTEGKVENTVPAYQRSLLQTPKPIYFNGLDSNSGAILHDRLIEDEVIASSTADSSVYPYGNTIGTWPLYCDQMGFVLDWALNKWKAEGKTGKPKIAIFGWDLAYGHAFWTESAKAYAAKLGFDVVGEYWFPVTQLDITPLAAKAKELNPDFTFCGATSIGTVVWAKAINSVGLNNIVNIGGNGFEFGTYKLAKPKFEGFYTVQSWASWNETDNPGIQKIRSVASAWDKKTEPSGFTISMWPGMVGLKMWFEQTVDRVGWEKGITGKELMTTVLSSNEIYPIEIEKGTVGWGGGISKEKYSPSRLRMFQAKENGAGGAGFYPASEWGDAPDLVPMSVRTGKKSK